jgi:hypothetical protein
MLPRTVLKRANIVSGVIPMYLDESFCMFYLGFAPTAERELLLKIPGVCRTFAEQEAWFKLHGRLCIKLREAFDRDLEVLGLLITGPNMI